jgi:hypothetical protein
VTDIGALGERVMQGINGLKIDVGSVEQLCTALRELNNSPDKLLQLKNPVFPVPSAQMAEHLTILDEIYSGLIGSSKKIADFMTKEPVMTNGVSISSYWASFPEQISSSKSQPNHSMISSIKAVLRRVLR